MGIIMRMKLRNADNKVRMMAMFFNKHYIFNKDSESRAQCKTKDKVFVFIAEAHPILGEAKDSANRRQSKTKYEVFVLLC